jgi:hypothetical protein
VASIPKMIIIITIIMGHEHKRGTGGWESIRKGA